MQEKNIKRIKFFKIEAEGAEPEVLEGSKNSLKIIDYIGVDGSHERGKRRINNRICKRVFTEE